MTRVIDLECYAPASLSDPDYHAIERGRPSTPFPEPLERPEGYGFANYEHVFQESSIQRPSVKTAPDDGGMEKLVAWSACCGAIPTFIATRRPIDRVTLRPRDPAGSKFLQFGNTLLQDKIMVGLSRALMGRSFEELIAEYEDLPLKDSVIEKWLYHNAVRFLRIG